MSEYNTISTDQWQISLPSDWAHLPQPGQNPGQFYFESADASKGAHLSVFTREDPNSSSLGDLAAWRNMEIENLHAMPDSNWVILEEWQHDEAGTAISGSDCLDKVKNYRILCLRMTQFPWLVRASLHDYDCRDYEASRRLFQPIMDSFSPVIE